MLRRKNHFCLSIDHFHIYWLLTENFIFWLTIMWYLKKKYRRTATLSSTFEALWICCHRIFLPIVAVFTLTTVLWWRSIVLRRREFFTWTKVFFQDDYLGEEQSKRDKWHKSVMYGLIKDEFAAWGHKAPRDNLFVNEVFPTHAIF